MNAGLRLAAACVVGAILVSGCGQANSETFSPGQSAPAAKKAAASEIKIKGLYIGMDIQTDGTLSVKSDKMSTAMNNLGELKKFFANSDAANVSNDGLSQRIKSLTTQLLGTDGAINSRTEGIKSLIERNKDKIERIDAKATLAEARLRAQYTLLDANMAKLNGLSSYVTAQLAALNKNN